MLQVLCVILSCPREDLVQLYHHFSRVWLWYLFDEDGIPITTKMRFDNDNDKDTTSGLRVPILLPVASWLMGVIRVCLQSSCPSPSVQPSRLVAPGSGHGWMDGIGQRQRRRTMECNGESSLRRLSAAQEGRGNEPIWWVTIATTQTMRPTRQTSDASKRKISWAANGTRGTDDADDGRYPLSVQQSLQRAHRMPLSHFFREDRLSPSSAPSSSSSSCSSSTA